MAQLDGAMRRLATNLMARFGTAVVVVRQADGVYDPTTGASARTTVKTNCKGVLQDVSAREAAMSGAPQGLIRAGDRRLSVAAADLGFAPQVDDAVEIGSRTYRVVAVEETRAVDKAALYVLLLRGSA